MGAMGAVMRAKKPDWAQRMVDNARLGIPTYMAVRTNYQDVPAECEPQAMVLVADLEKQKTRVAAILRAHHRKVKRMVQVLQQPKHGLCGYTLAQVLAKMKELER